MHIEIITHESGFQLPILLDKEGLPTPTPNEFILSKITLGLNTQKRNLRELTILFKWLDSSEINLWERIQSHKLFSETELNSGLGNALRRSQETRTKVKKIAVTPRTFNQRLLTVIEFMTWCFDIEMHLIEDGDKRFSQFRDKKNIVLKTLQRMFISSPPSNKSLSKGLTEKQLKFLLWIINPANPEAFGQDKVVKFRNYVIVSILASFGLRPGELLSLRVNDIELGAISALRILRRPVDKADERKPRPFIKRNGRVFAIEERALIKHIDEYILNWREISLANSSKDTEYLILSDEGIPLSQSTVTHLFQRLRNTYPNDLPRNLTAKSLRHSFSANLERQLLKMGMDEDSRASALAEARGDSSTKSQLVYLEDEIKSRVEIALTYYQRSILTGVTV